LHERERGIGDRRRGHRWRAVQAAQAGLDDSVGGDADEWRVLAFDARNDQRGEPALDFLIHPSRHRR
jgi:hypothetical protein